MIFLPKFSRRYRKERPSGSSGPNDKADCERDERLPWRHELASYLAIAGHPE